MRSSGAPTLFAPPRPPVLVPRTRPVVLGRSAECDLPIDSPRASRRHAQVRLDGDRVVVEDLGSRNGTFVNGERLTGTRPLSGGDRIDVGGVTGTFCRSEGAGRELADDVEATAVFAAPQDLARGEGVLKGDLAEVGLPAVLQVLAEGGKTGLLSVAGPRGPARLWLRGGRPVHAGTARAEGLEAALEACRLAEGRFLFAPGLPPPASTIALPVTALLLEANRVADERLA